MWAHPTDTGGAATQPAHRWRVRAVCLLAGALPALAFPEPSVWLLGVIGLVPLMWLVCAAPAGHEAVWRVWLGGIGFFIAVHHWLIPVTGPFVVPLAMTLAILWIPWGRIAWALLGTRPNPARLAGALLLVPSAWVVAEYLRSWDRLGGPWGLLGATQWQNRTLLAVVSIGGVWLLSYVLVAGSVALAAALLPGEDRKAPVIAVAAAVLLIAAASAYSIVQPEPEPAGSFAVAGVQTGIVHGRLERFDAHIEMTRTLVDDDFDLVVWPESSVAADLPPGSARLQRLQEVAEEVGAPLLVNVDARRGSGGIFKSSVLVGPDGIQDRYDKMRLVPFGEYVPLRPLFGWLSAITDAADEDRRSGQSLRVMEVDGVAIGPLVCFESAFPDLSRHLVHRGADVIVLQTATTTFQGSWAQPQHASLGAVRAVETSRPVVHSTLSGVTGIFAADGTRLASLGSDEIGTWQANLDLTTGTTFYVRTGDWVPVVSALVLLAGLATVRLRAVKQPQETPTTSERVGTPEA
jgi:apolipoprotein N-acyltransferase